MDGNWIFAVEPIMVLLLVSAFVWWELRQLDKLKREREAREAEERRSDE